MYRNRANIDVVSQSHFLAEYIKNLQGFEMVKKPIFTYEHMGAITADAVLQAGLRYDTVVAPRVRFICERYPEAKSLNGLLCVVAKIGASRLLKWSHPEKPRRFRELLRVLRSAQIDTAYDLRLWLFLKDSRNKLTSICGIGPKTVDYMGCLVGLESVAVDRHLLRLLQQSGIDVKKYEEAKEIFMYASKLLSVQPRVLDHSIWLYLSRKNVR